MRINRHDFARRFAVETAVSPGFSSPESRMLRTGLINERSTNVAEGGCGFGSDRMLRWLIGLFAVAIMVSTVLIAGAETRAPAVEKLRALYKRPTDIPFPASNPYSESKAKLGQLLFFDPILSGSQTRSCATCHNPSLSWTDGLPLAVGEKQKALNLKSPTLLNIAWIEPLGWTGHFKTLESVAFGPINSAKNMNASEKLVIRRLSAIPDYVLAFDGAFGAGPVTKKKIEDALATYERTIVSAEAPFDRWIHGDENAIGTEAKAGFALFNGKARCSSCHRGWLFTDNSFHDIGVARAKDAGRGRLFPTSTKLKHAFKVPTLRDVARRAPYMHDGSLRDLHAVLDLYSRGGINRPSRSAQIVPLHLTEKEKKQLIAFLDTLTSPSRPVKIPAFPR
jgi:cytochrome c peroxidase